LINFSNNKQTQKNLKNNFSKITFQKTNTKQMNIEAFFVLVALAL